uniref:Transposase of ISCARN46, ORFA, IS3 family IS3 group n=1 Tax=mine drainage metagenome TaxID=410659 RepID=E6PEQ3_9ZZZZ
MGKERRTFSAEFKRDAVARIAASGQGLSQTARSLGIHPSLLQSWRRKLEAANESSGSPPKESLEEENRRLRRENASLREDREVLKKAATFFAKESR